MHSFIRVLPRLWIDHHTIEFPSFPQSTSVHNESKHSTIHECREACKREEKAEHDSERPKKALSPPTVCLLSGSKEQS
jgi:hypothetical protein